jgi:hypothetical protein
LIIKKNLFRLRYVEAVGRRRENQSPPRSQLPCWHQRETNLKAKQPAADTSIPLLPLHKWQAWAPPLPFATTNSEATKSLPIITLGTAAEVLSVSSGGGGGGMRSKAAGLFFSLSQSLLHSLLMVFGISVRCVNGKQLSHCLSLSKGAFT